MKIFCLVFLIFLSCQIIVATATASQQPSLEQRVTKAANTIKKFEVEALVDLLSSPRYAGRYAYSSEYAAAAYFMAERLAALGYRPLPGQDSIVQPFRLALENGQIITSYNVIGYIPGTTAEYILVGAHLDHLGRDPMSHESAYPQTNYFPGADDNASGVAAVDQIAMASALLPRDALKRGVIIAYWGAEEGGPYSDGLVGSEWFAKRLEMGVYANVLTLKSIITALNFDMVGRRYKRDDPWDGGHKTVLIAGAKGVKTFSDYYRKNQILANLIMHIVADDPDFDPTLWVTFDERLESPWRKMPGHSIVGRSDSYSFLRRGVSTLFFCGPEHPDYHTIRDTPDKVDYDRLTRISRLGFRITARLATHRIYPICIACD